MIGPLRRLLTARRLAARGVLPWHLTGPGAVPLEVADLADWHVFGELFVNAEYDPALEPIVAADAGRDALVLDLGANVGFFTLRAIARWRARQRTGRLRVIAVEGAPTTAATLRRRLDAVPAGDDVAVSVHRALVGRRSGSATIHTVGGFHAVSTVVATSEVTRAGTAVQVPFVDLEAIVPAGARIDLLKCDIEGSEETFLASYPALLRRVERAVLEFHPQLCDVPRCRALLAEAGLERVHVQRADATQSVEHFGRVVA